MSEIDVRPFGVDAERLLACLKDVPAHWLAPEPEVWHGDVVFRASAADFQVDELPLYTPSGEGEHLYIHVKKTGLSSPALVRHVRRVFGVKERDIGVPGRKDTGAVTTQWISVPARNAPDPSALNVPGVVEVLDAARHGNKLRMGHLAGNRFSLVVRGTIDVPTLKARAERMGGRVLNGFGPQRFGWRGPDKNDKNMLDAFRFLARERPAKRRGDKFAVSILQSAVFNCWLHARQRAGHTDVPLVGDVLQFYGRHASYFCDDVQADTARIAAGEVTPSGPMPGAKMRRARDESLTFTSRILRECGVDLDRLSEQPGLSVGTRRPMFLPVQGLQIEAVDGGARVGFVLGKGSYATVILQELFAGALVDAGATADCDAAFAALGTHQAATSE